MQMKARNSLIFLLWTLSVFFACAILQAEDETKEQKLNVLFIAIDDLKPVLNCYGARQIHSPNIDRLAARGTQFIRAYCQQALCNPSRASVLTGCRPDTNGVHINKTHFRENKPDVVTLPQHFRNNGYACYAYGKIYHAWLRDPPSWTEPQKPIPHTPYGIDENNVLTERLRKEAKAKGDKGRVMGPAWEAADVPDNRLEDGMIADIAIQKMAELANQPFFLAVGFFRPHLPFVAPKKYWDLYDEDDIKFAKVQQKPQGAPDYALNNWGELRCFYQIPKEGPVSDEQAKKLIHGYYACVSFIDAQVGKLMAALDKLGLKEKTIVVLWGDHGWHLGDHGLWCKHTNFEESTHSPLIIHAPGKRSGKTEALVEFIDIYPTIADLAGLPLPKHLEGKSLIPLMDDPALEWSEGAVSQFPRWVPERKLHLMGYSIRTKRYRLTEWVNNPKWADKEQYFREVELYDYEKDPLETKNFANDPSYAETKSRLLDLLHSIKK